MNYLSTWFYAETDDDESDYPSVGGHLSSIEFQKAYWECVFDFFSSAHLTQRSDGLELLFFTNVKKLPSNLAGIDFEAYFKDLGVRVFCLELTHKVPKDWHGAWRNQFYLLDILNVLKDIKGNHLLLDSDCLITKDLSGLYELIGEKGIVCYDCDDNDSNDDDINGTSMSEMGTIIAAYTKKDCEPVRYKGGEFVGATSEAIFSLCDEFDQLWSYDYHRYEKGLTKLTEEAHLLSALYKILGYGGAEANSYVKRMWTAATWDTVVKGDENKAIWHLPAEKKYAFARLLPLIRGGVSREQFLMAARSETHITWPRPLRRLANAIEKIKHR